MSRNIFFLSVQSWIFRLFEIHLSSLKWSTASQFGRQLSPSPNTLFFIMTMMSFKEHVLPTRLSLKVSLHPFYKEQSLGGGGGLLKLEEIGGHYHVSFREDWTLRSWKSCPKPSAFPQSFSSISSPWPSFLWSLPQISWSLPIRKWFSPDLKPSIKK